MIALMDQLDPAAAALTDLGFSRLEALAYLHLLQAGPETAYATAKAVGKAVANTYKAIESLERKGAVEVLAGEPRLVRAAPPEEVLGRLRRGFERRSGEAREAFARLDRREPDERVYHLAAAAQVIARARAMIEEARACVLVDLFPAVAAALAPELEAAAARGIAVVALVYDDADLAGCEVVRHSRGALVRRFFAGEHLVLCTDAEQALLALLDSPNVAAGPGDADPWPETGGVRQAIHTASPFVAWHLHDNVHHQVHTYAVAEAFADEPELMARVRAVHDTRLAGIAPIATPGWRALMDRHGTAEARALTDELLAGRSGTTPLERWAEMDRRVRDETAAEPSSEEADA